MQTLALEKYDRVDVRLKQAIESGTLPKDLLICGPAGTGKTYAILSVLHQIAQWYDNVRILICRQTRRSLTESVQVTFEQEILAGDGMESICLGANRNTRRAYDYPSGSTIVLGGMDNPERITSTSWDFVFINEAIELQENAWDILWSRLNRPGRPSWAGYLIGDTNPGDPSHWLRRRIDEGQTVLWDTTHEANPALHDGYDWTPAGAQYREGLEKLKGTRRRRYFDGLWAAGEGQWFDGFDPDRHVTKTAAYDSRYPVILAVDSGVHTGAVWVQVYGEGENATVAIVGDYYKYGASARDNAAAVLKKTREITGGRWDRGVTDPAYKADTAVGPTVKSEYEAVGLKLDSWPSYPGSVMDGLSLIESFIDRDKLLVSPDCKSTIDAMANYKRAMKKNQYIDRPVDPQHPFEEIIDSIRGALQDKYPDGRKGPPKFNRVSARRVF